MYVVLWIRNLSLLIISTIASNVFLNCYVLSKDIETTFKYLFFTLHDVHNKDKAQLYSFMCVATLNSN